MKTNSLKYLLLSLCACMLLTTCMDEEYINVRSEKQGEPVNLTLRYSSPSNQKVFNTKSTEEEERYLSELRVYIFDNSTEGKLIGYQKYEKLTPDSNGEGNISINTQSGTAYIYAVANIQSNQYYVDRQTKDLLDVTDLSSSTLTREQFLALNFIRQPKAITPLDNLFLMSGYVNDGNSVVIGEKGTISADNAEAKILKLYRVVAKHTFTVNPYPESSGIQFQLLNYQIYNVAEGGKLLPLATDELTTSNVEQHLDESQVTMGNTISFYLPENKRGLSSNTISAWKEREKDTYSTSGIRTFTNAPENSTYIVLRGKYNEGRRTADVEYTIHLGDFGTHLKDYNVNRNYSYTYTIKVKGVEDIIVEAKATSSDTDNPYVEGLVVDYGNGYLYEVDAHYEARVMKFYQKKAVEGTNPGYVLYFNTPFGESKNLWVTKEGIYDNTLPKASPALYTFNEDGTIKNRENGKLAHLLLDETKEDDYRWVHFIKNANDDQNVCAYKTDAIDVFELLYTLLTAKDNYFPYTADDGRKYAMFTCFIDENYYEDKNWGEYVNQPNRIMHIANTMNFSLDKKSQYTNVAYTISQKPIYTFYNRDLSESVVAYGVESVQEEDLYGLGYPAEQYGIINNQNWDGNGMAYKNICDDTKNGYGYTGISWNGNAIRKPGIQLFYKTVSKACMSRNRDLNGNGFIDEEECRWYLPGVDQLIGLWMGEDLLPLETRLFDINDMKTFTNGTYLAPYHLYTASTQSIFWPEEGTSTSRVGQGKWSVAESVRCVRTLRSKDAGVSTSGNSKGKADFYYTTKEVIGGTQISVDKVNEKALRTFSWGPLASEHERKDQNRLSQTFMIRNAYLSRDYLFDEIIGVKPEEDVCHKELGGQWRVPNQRELAMIVSATPEYTDGNGFWSNSKFSGIFFGKGVTALEGEEGKGYKVDGERHAFRYSGGWNATGNITVACEEKNKVRCVRDVQ